MPVDCSAYYYKTSKTILIYYYMVEAMDYTEEVLTKGLGRIQTSLDPAKCISHN